MPQQYPEQKPETDTPIYDQLAQQHVNAAVDAAKPTIPDAPDPDVEPDLEP
ncbi:hypothetical protein GCM10027586_04470 [Kineococcus gypseus]